jgi:cytochrome c551/c552
MKKILAFLIIPVFIFSCSSNTQNAGTDENKADDTYQPTTTAAEHPELKDEVENNRGIGKFTHVDLSSTLDKKLADAGNSVYELKCYSCHKLTDEKLVGPGWKGVTQRRAPEWIMNFATNTDEMLTSDPQAKAMLEICLIRMPNQNLTEDDARKVLEFMRENDGLK